MWVGTIRDFNGSLPMMPSFRVMSGIAVVVAVTLACATLIWSYLTLMSATGSRCEGQDLLLGYRTATSDLLALPVMSAFVAALAEKVRRSQKTIDLLEKFDLTLLQLGSFRATYGMLLVYAILFGLSFGNANMAEFSFRRYATISAHCQSKESFSGPFSFSGSFKLR